VANQRIDPRGNAPLFRSVLDRAWPVDGAPSFSGLLDAIDEADRELSRRRKRQDLG
jgi:hypothetical protein